MFSINQSKLNNSLNGSTIWYWHFSTILNGMILHTSSQCCTIQCNFVHFSAIIDQIKHFCKCKYYMVLKFSTILKNETILQISSPYGIILGNVVHFSAISEQTQQFCKCQYHIVLNFSIILNGTILHISSPYGTILCSVVHLVPYQSRPSNPVNVSTMWYWNSVYMVLTFTDLFGLVWYRTEMYQISWYGTMWWGNVSNCFIWEWY